MTIVLSSFRARLHAAEREIAIEALTATHGAVNPAARLCGLHPSQLRRIIKRHNLQPHLSRHAPRGGNEAWRELGEA